MPEVQQHGFSFETWVRENIFAGYSGEYSQKWDIPAENNQHNVLPDEIENLPVSVKTVQFGSSIALGDVIRQRQISEPFLIIAGFWTQRTPQEKWFQDLVCVRFSTAVWEKLWGPLTLADLEEFDAAVKDLTIPPETARANAQLRKKKMTEKGKSTLVINPKIGSGTQRRVQCSIPFNDFWKVAGRKARHSDSPKLFGVPFQNPITSRRRVFDSKKPTAE